MHDLAGIPWPVIAAHCSVEKRMDKNKQVLAALTKLVELHDLKARYCIRDRWHSTEARMRYEAEFELAWADAREIVEAANEAGKPS